MKAYSQDLRERVIAAVKQGVQSQSEIAETFGVSPSTVEAWWRRWRTTRSVAALPHAGGNPRVLSECTTTLRTAVKQQPDITLAELCEQVAEQHDAQASPSMMCRELQRLRLPRKKSRSTTASATRRG
jgi:transposase